MCKKKQKKIYKVLNYIEHLLILVSGCVLISSFASLVGIPLSIVSSAKGLKICVITGVMSMSKKKRKQDKIALLSKDKLNTIDVITSNDLTDLYIKHHEFFFSE